MNFGQYGIHKLHHTISGFISDRESSLHYIHEQTGREWSPKIMHLLCIMLWLWHRSSPDICIPFSKGNFCKSLFALTLKCDEPWLRLSLRILGLPTGILPATLEYELAGVTWDTEWVKPRFNISHRFNSHAYEEQLGAVMQVLRVSEGSVAVRL